MVKFKNFIKKYYIVFIVLGVIILLLGGSLLVIKLINYYKYHVDVKTIDTNMYQYVSDKKYSFEAKITTGDDAIIGLKSREYDIYDYSPVYYENEKHLIIPKDCVMIFYLQNNKSYRLPKYSELLIDNDTNIISVGGKKYFDNHFILYDGVDLFIFSDEVTIQYNGKKLELSPYSYVIANSEVMLAYDYAKDEITKVKDIKSIFALYDNLNINLLKKVIVKNDKVSMIYSNMDKLKVYKENQNG